MSLKAILWALYDAPTDDAQSALILVALAENAHDDGTSAWPSVATIARKARCSERTVHRRLRELTDEGLLRRGDQRLVGHLDPRYRPVVYDLAVHRIRGDSVTPLAEVRGDRPGSSGVTPVADEPSIEPTTIPPTPPGDEPLPISVADVGAVCDTGNMDKPVATRSRPKAVTDDDPQWSAFWAAYPRKTGKGAARKAWPKALAAAGGDAQLIVTAAVKFAGAKDRTTEFTPHPATWLNAERWTDEVEQGATGARWVPAKAGSDEECSEHKGERAASCRICASERIGKSRWDDD